MLHLETLHFYITIYGLRGAWFNGQGAEHVFRHVGMNPNSLL